MTITLYIFNIKGENIYKYTIFERKNHNLLLTNFVIDKINNYSYIPFYDRTSNDDNNKAVFFITNLKDLYTNKVYLNDSKFLYDSNYIFENNLIQKYFKDIVNKIINVALSCDGEYLLFCPLSSPMIYSLSTKTIRDNNTKSISINIFELKLFYLLKTLKFLSIC